MESYDEFLSSILESARSDEGTWSLRIYQLILKTVFKYKEDQVFLFMDKIVDEMCMENTGSLTRFKLAQLCSFLTSERVFHAYEGLSRRKNMIEDMCKKYKDDPFGKETQTIFVRIFSSNSIKRGSHSASTINSLRFPIKCESRNPVSFTPSPTIKTYSFK